jgi:zinc protease
VRNTKFPVVSFQLTVDIDPMLEGDKVGLADFTGNLISKGSPTRNKDQVNEEVDYMGATFSTFSGGFYATSLKKHTEKLLSISSDVFLNPAFPAEELEKQKKQAISGLKSLSTNPDAIMANVSKVLRYGKNHPFGEIQKKEHIENITIEDCKNYYSTYFRPNNSYLVIVGDATLEEAKKWANYFFGKWEKKEVPTHKYKNPNAPEGAVVSFVNKPGAVQSVVNVTYPVELSLNSSDYLASQVMNEILGGSGFGGKLMQNLRESKSYTYGAYSSLTQSKQVGSFKAGASVRNEVTDSAVTEIIREMRNMIEGDFTETHLQNVKNNLNGKFALSLESPQTVARFALNIDLYKLPKDYYDTYLQRLDALTLEDVKAAARKYITPRNCHVVVVGNQAEVAEKLAVFASDGKVNYYDYFGDTYVEKLKEAPAGVSVKTVYENYLKAITSTSDMKKVSKKLVKVTGMRMTMKTEVQGMSIEMVSTSKQPDKLLMTVGANGMTLSKTIVNGDKGKTTGMMGNKEMDADEVAQMKKQINIFKEMQPVESGTTLAGIDEYNGEEVYKIVNPDSSFDYYSVKTGFKVYSESTQKTEQGSTTVTSELSDYKEVGGIKFAHKRTQNMGPQVLELNVSKIELNPKVADTEFTIK